MTSPLRAQDRLDELAADVRRYSEALLPDERASKEATEFDPSDGEDAAEIAFARAEAHALETRLRRDAALIAYFEESEKERARTCPIHGEVIFISCPDCLQRMPTRAA